MAILRHGDYMAYMKACEFAQALKFPVLVWQQRRGHCLAASDAMFKYAGITTGLLQEYALWCDHTVERLYNNLHGRDMLQLEIYLTTADKQEFLLPGWIFYPRNYDGTHVLQIPALGVWIGEGEPNAEEMDLMRQLADMLANPEMPAYVQLNAEKLNVHTARKLLEEYDGIAYIKDTQSNLLAGTDGFARHVAVSQREHLLGLDMRPLLTPSAIDLSASLDRNTIEYDVVTPYTHTNRRVADMVHSWRTIVRFPIHNLHNDVVGMLLTLSFLEEGEDIALEYQRTKRYFDMLHDMSDTLPHVVIVWRANGTDTLDYVSKSIKNWGYSPLDLVEIGDWTEIVVPEDRESFLRKRTELIQHPRRGGYDDYRVRLANGTERMVHEEIEYRPDALQTAWLCSTIMFSEELIDRHRLHRQMEIDRHIRLSIEKNQQHVTMLNSLYRDLNRSHELDGFLRLGLAEASRTFQLPLALIWEEVQGAYLLSLDYQDKRQVSLPLPLPSPSQKDVEQAASAVMHNETIRVDDVNQLPEYWQRLTKDVGARQIFLAAMGQQNHWYGMICFFDLSARRWISDDARALTQFAQMLAAALFRKRTQDHLLQIAYEDAALHIPNRQKLEQDLQQLVTARRQGLLFIMDINNLKMVRNAYGMSYGDALLSGIRDHIRASGKLPYRFSNDEFALILEGWDEQRLTYWVELIFQRFQSVWDVLDRQVFATVNGGASGIAGAESVGAILRRADAARMAANARGLPWMMYSDAHQEALRQMELVRDMHDAVSKNCEEFVVYYQPIYDLQRHSFRYAESLIRWNHPRLGFLAPGTFIEVGEETGLILPITWFVLREALRQVRIWRQRWPHFAVTVNLSRRQLREKDTARIVEECLREADVPPEALILELTETMAIEDMNASIQMFSSLRALGVRIALDDFGVGLSSLSALDDLPLDIIKIDKSFVQHGSNYDRHLIEFVAQVAKLKDMRVCTEGVETPEQWALARDHGATHIQGYIATRPLPPERAEEVMAAWMPEQGW